MRTWKLQINEDELRALIEHNVSMLLSDPNTDRSARVHDLTKRLTKDTPEIEGDPRPKEENRIEGWN